jgi:hypothetical protein
MPSVASGTYGQLRLEANVAGSSVAGIYWDVSWALWFDELSGPNLSWNGGDVPANVQITGPGYVWSGSFGFDWRPGGLQSTLIASGVTRIYGNADGTPPNPFYMYGVIGATGSSGGGSGATVGGAFLALPTLKQLPGTPTSVAAARVSDTSINVTWAQSSASNGQPTANTIRRRINGGAWADAVTIAPATSTALAAAANQKIEYAVKATNSVGDTAWSATSAPVYTTPGAPTGVVATKVGLDISLAWTPNVAFTEHQHVIEHGVDVAGVVTWDGSALATITAGTSSYTHTAPNPAQRHVYRVRSRNTDVGALSSATVQSNVVQLLTAPAKPTVPAPAAFQDKAAIFRLSWVHNPIDSSAQTKRQVRYSLDGGSTWTTGAKTTSTAEFLDYAANTWVANNAVTFQVRTKGAYDAGSDADASYSPWSDSVTVTFKTKPVATITSPANASVVTTAALTVVLGFSQAESATFVNATIGLYQGATLLEEIVSTTLAGTLFATRVADGGSYTVKAVVKDSNGLNSAQVSSAFTVDYIEPVAAVVVVTYLPDSGIAQLGLTVPAAGGGLVAATSVTIDRVIDGVTENVVSLYPSAASLTFLDTTPTIHGTNLYRVTTRSVDGATTVVQATLITTEDEWAFLSKGPGYQEIIRFQLAPGVQATPTVDSALVKAAGRRRPIGLYSTAGGLVVSGAGALAEGYGSDPVEIEEFLLVAGKGCYRDPTGRRLFGMIAGSITRAGSDLGQLAYTVTETD